jgi:hypothetical protein
MTYDPTQPPSTTSPALSVTDIQTNFAQFFTKFKVNHVPLNDFNQGKHSTVIFEKQTDDPEVTDDQVTVYAKDTVDVFGTEPQLFAKILESDNLPNLPFQLTLNQVNTTGPNQYQSFVMGGYLVYVGKTNNIAANITLVPAPLRILCAQAVPQAVGGTGIPYTAGVVVTDPDTIKINSSNAPGGTTFLWFAIGATQ